jgi:hypothetical protein
MLGGLPGSDLYISVLLLGKLAGRTSSVRSGAAGSADPGGFSCALQGSP